MPFMHEAPSYIRDAEADRTDSSNRNDTLYVFYV